VRIIGPNFCVVLRLRGGVVAEAVWLGARARARLGRTVGMEGGAPRARRYCVGPRKASPSTCGCLTSPTKHVNSVLESTHAGKAPGCGRGREAAKLLSQR
jgi:hypothetical protein